MKKLQAAMKDASYSRARNNRHCYKVGSYMKGCANCGDTIEDENGRTRYTSGFNVFRSYQPSWTGWTWMCSDCGAKDLRAWSVDSVGVVLLELGKDAIRGTADAVKARKYALRKEALALNPEAQEKIKVNREFNRLVNAPVDPRTAKIAELKRQIEELKARIGQ